MPAFVNENSLVRSSVGNKFRITGTLTFTTYQTGGPVVNANQLDLDQIEWFELENAGGNIFYPIVSFDQSKVNLKGFTPGTGASSITPVVNELVAVVADTGTLANIPSTVQNVYAVGGVTGAFLIVPSTIAPASGEVSINMATGVLTFNAADTIAAASVTYTGRVTGGGGGGSSEIGNGTDLSALGAIQFECTGI